MKCWACKTKMRCVESEPFYEGRQRIRRYACPKCGENTHTLERIITIDEYREKYRKAYKENTSG